jgi:hypothetical protein
VLSDLNASVGFDHLVAMKEAAGRPEDEIDLKRLREFSRGRLRL